MFLTDKEETLGLDACLALARVDHLFAKATSLKPTRHSSEETETSVQVKKIHDQRRRGCKTHDVMIGCTLFESMKFNSV